MIRGTTRWRALLCLTWVVYSIALALLYVRVPPSPDQSLYDYMGWVLSQGGIPYVDTADHNFPGDMLAHAVSSALFGNTLWSFRLLDYLWMLGTCACAFLLVRGSAARGAALLAVPLYQALYVTGTSWFAGQRDVMAAPLLLVATLAWLRRAQGGGRVWCVLEGFALAGAALLRPTFLLLGLLLSALDVAFARRTGRRFPALLADSALAGGSCVAALALVVLLAIPSGAFAAWQEVSLRFVLEVYAAPVPLAEVTRRLLGQVVSWNWYWVVSAFGLMLLWRGGGQLAAGGLLAIVASAFGSAYAQGKGFGYHLGPLLPVFAIGMALAVHWALGALRSSSRSWLRSGWALALCAVVTGGLTLKVVRVLRGEIGWYAGTVTSEELLARYPAGDDVSLADAVKLAELVRAEVPPHETVLWWGTPLVVNFLAERRSPIRFQNVAYLSQPTESFTHFEAWANELRAAFSERPPRMLLLVRRPEDADYLYVGPRARVGSQYGDIVRTALSERYRLVRTVGRVDCYRLIDPASAPRASR